MSSEATESEGKCLIIKYFNIQKEPRKRRRVPPATPKSPPSAFKKFPDNQEIQRREKISFFNNMADKMLKSPFSTFSPQTQTNEMGQIDATFDESKLVHLRAIVCEKKLQPEFKLSLAYKIHSSAICKIPIFTPIPKRP
jgi:hypothetical protein